MKKTKFMTRLGAVVFALAILFAMAVPAFADTTIPTGNDTGIAQDVTNDVYSALSTTITLKKQIVFKNPDGESVRYPNVTFTYAITSATPAANTTITDTDNDVANVKAGPIGALTTTTGSIVLTDSTYSGATSANGTAVDVGTVSFTFTDTSAFQQPGVYRYKISDTTLTTDANALVEAGITRDDDYEADRFLDVYVRRNSDSGELEIYGYVLIEEGDDFSQTTSVNKDTEKSNGWIYNYDENDPTAGDVYMEDVDVYQTYNVKVSKAVTGALADTSNKFPFTITFANTTETDITKIDVKTNDATKAALGTVTADAQNSGKNYVSPRAAYVTGGIADGGTLTITGIPTNTTVDVVETNNTYDEYTASATVAGAAVKINSNKDSDKLAHSATADLDTVVAVAAATTKEIKFTNNLTELSPTGLAFRVAPYVLMLAAGISLVLLFAKRRREITDMI